MPAWRAAVAVGVNKDPQAFSKIPEIGLKSLRVGVLLKSSEEKPQGTRCHVAVRHSLGAWKKATLQQRQINHRIPLIRDS